MVNLFRIAVAFSLLSLAGVARAQDCFDGEPIRPTYTGGSSQHWGIAGIAFVGTDLVFTKDAPSALAVMRPAISTGYVQAQLLATGGSVYSIEAEADTIVVGESNAVRTFRRQANGVYVQVSVLSAPAINEGWGVDLGLGEDALTLAVGAPFAGADPLGDSGSVYVYTRLTTSAVWSLLTTLTPAAGPVAFAEFGSHVAVSGTKIAVADGGDYGYVFSRSGNSYSQQARFTDTSSGVEIRISADWVWYQCGSHINAYRQVAGTTTWQFKQALSPGSINGWNFKGGVLAVRERLSQSSTSAVRIRCYQLQGSQSTWSNSFTGDSQFYSGYPGYYPSPAVKGDLVAVSAPGMAYGSVDEFGGGFVFDTAFSDCNENGTADECDVATGSSDLNLNGVPDLCENGPAIVSASDGQFLDCVQITWSPFAGATGYSVFRAIGAGTPSQIGSVGSVLSYSDTTAVPGILYAYSLRAVTANGVSGWGTIDSGWRDLSPPMDVDASDGTEDAGVVVTWTESLGAIEYQIFRKLGSDGAVQIGSAYGGGSQFIDVTAFPEIVYTYTVRTIGEVGDSEMSLGATGYLSLAAPVDVNATDGASSSNVVVTWSASAGALGYQVFRAVGANTPDQIGTVESGEFTFIDTTAEPATLYGYSVRTIGTLGVSPPSLINSGYRALFAPTEVGATDGTLTNGVLVTWAPSDFAIGYKVYRANSSGTLVLSATVVSPAWLDQSTATGTLYTYAVKAIGAVGMSSMSITDTGWKNILAPAGVAASDGTLSTGVAISWFPSNGATGYRVFRDSSSSPIATVGTVLTFTDTTAVADVVYTYTVQALIGLGMSALSASDTGYRSGPPTITTVAPSAGPVAGNTPITITGTNLSGAVNVKVGGVAATSVVVVNATTITAKTPAGTVGAKDVTLTTSGGTATTTGGFTYVALPTITTVTPSAGPVAGNTPITITGTNLSGAVDVKVGGVAATSVVVVNATTITAKTPAGTVGAKDVTLTTSGGTATKTGGFTYVASFDGDGDDGGVAGDSESSTSPPDSGGADQHPTSDPVGGTGDSQGEVHDLVDDVAGFPEEYGELPDACMLVAVRLAFQIQSLDAQLHQTNDANTMTLVQELIDRLRKLLKPASEFEPVVCLMARGDVSRDGTINDVDLGAFLAAWAADDLVDADLDRDGHITAEDLSIVLGAIDGASKLDPNAGDQEIQGADRIVTHADSKED